MPSRYELHVAEWKNCVRCELSRCRRRVVLARGRLPCDVLFVGEAPGESEDVLGRPFVGPAGKLLDLIVGRSVPDHLSCAYTNLVGCIPRVEDGNKAGEPPEDAIAACRPRVEELAELASPRLLVAVGKLAREWLAPGYTHSVKVPPCRRLDLNHPAFMLRANVAQRGLLIQRAVVNLADACEGL